MNDVVSMPSKALKEFQAKHRWLKELIERHRICTTCGKQLSETEWKSEHTCYDEQALWERKAK